MALQRLDIDMERICAYIEQEIEQSTSFREQKLLVAEYGLLDAQLSTLLSMLQNSDVSKRVACKSVLLQPMTFHDAYFSMSSLSCLIVGCFLADGVG